LGAVFASALMLTTGCGTPVAAEMSKVVSYTSGNHMNGEILTSRQGMPIGDEAVVRVDWRKELLEPELLEWQPREFTRPAVDDSGHVYVATRDGYIRCLDSEGVILWEYKTKGPFYGSVELDNDKLFVPSADGALLALDANDGTLKWSYRAGEELGSRPVIANGIVYVASFADAIFALDEETGAWKWQYRRDTSAEFTIRGVATPVVDFDKLFIGFSDGAAVCLDANDGTLKWAKQLSSAQQFPDADADPQLDGQGHVIFASYASGLFSLDEDTGAIVWAQSVSGITTMLVDNDTLYTGGQGAVSARSIQGGQERWHYKLGDSFCGMPTVAGRYVVFPTTQALVFLERKNGRPHRPFNPGRGVSAPPAFREGQLFVVSNYGYVYALSLNRPGGKG
jgi:outer membrane protein assembly factor BamB